MTTIECEPVALVMGSSKRARSLPMYSMGESVGAKRAASATQLLHTEVGATTKHGPRPAFAGARPD